jgi:flagellar P-ring protein precursor FlgI
MRKTVGLILLALTCLATPAWAVKVADITRIGGQRSNVLTGLGLVYGLKGTGDGGDFLPAIRPLAGMLGKFSDTSSIAELSNVSNVALVSLTATVPANGVRDGDKLDVYVTSIGAASSLKGGRLFVTPMRGPIPGSGIFALSEGPVVLEDPSTPTVGVIKAGCVMEADLRPTMIENGQFTLVLEEPSASWTMASAIAKAINTAGDGDEGETLAVVIDPKNVVVTIPKAEQARPDSFISRVQRLDVYMVPTEARVTINDRTGTIIMTGDVEISPVVISHKGLTITTINPAPVPSAARPVVSSKEVVALDTTNQGGGKLQDLVNAMDQLKVPAEDRIAIVKDLYTSGRLHAKLIIE